MLLLFQNIVDGVASIWHAPCKLMKKVNSIECLNCQSFYNFSISGLSLLKKISPKIPLTKNPSIYSIVCWADGTNDSSTKRLILQLLKILQNSLQKLFQFVFFIYIKSILCNFSMRMQKCFLKKNQKFFWLSKHGKTT